MNIDQLRKAHAEAAKLMARAEQLAKRRAAAGDPNKTVLCRAPDGEMLHIPDMPIGLTMKAELDAQIATIERQIAALYPQPAVEQVEALAPIEEQAEDGATVPMKQVG